MAKPRMSESSPTSVAQVGYLKTFTQPPSSTDLLGDTDAGGVRRRPSIIVGADSEALAAVRTVHSPKGSSGTMFSSPKTTLQPVRGAWRRKMLRSGWTGPADAVLSVLALLVSMHCYGLFLRWNENRTDVEAFTPLSDPLLPHLTAADCSVPLTVLVYGAIAAAFKYTYTKPDVFLEFVQTHAAVMWVRMLSLYLTPLEAPVGTVPLVDPVAHPDGAVLVRDLFFSGHTATTFGLFVGVRRHDRKWKLFFAAITLVTAVLVLFQKAHYSIDVFAAPFFVHTTHSFVVTARQKISNMITGHVKSPIAGMTKTKKL